MERESEPLEKLNTGTCKESQGEQLVTIELSETEQKALDRLRSIAVDGLADVPAIGTDEEVVFTATQSPLMTTSDASNDCTPSSSRTKRITTDEMFTNFMDLIKGKTEEERAFRSQTLESIKKHTESINKLTAVKVSLAQNIVKKTQNIAQKK